MVEGCHVLEGDGCIPNFCHYVWKKKHSSVYNQHELRVPSTVVYSDGFPKEWFVVTKQGEFERRVGKDINTKEILKDMCLHYNRQVVEEGSIVAWYMYKLPGVEKPVVEFFDRKGLDVFLHGDVIRRDGFLQKFVLPDGKRNVVIQAIWSPNPAACVVGKRENKLCFYDRRHTMTERAITYEGPTHYSQEAFVAPHIQWQVKRLCQEFVDHFYNTDHIPIKRMVLHFKVDYDSEVWILWASSMRIVSYGKRNPLHLGVEYLSKYDVGQTAVDPQHVSLLEGSSGDYANVEEHGREILRDAAAAEKSPEEARNNVFTYNPTPPSLGPLGDVYSSCHKFNMRMRRIKRIRRLRREAYEAASQPLLHLMSSSGMDRSFRGRDKIFNTSPVTPTFDRARMGVSSVLLKFAEGEWDVRTTPLPRPGARYYWELVKIALHTKFLVVMAYKQAFEDWIELNSAMEQNKVQRSQTHKTEVSMPHHLYDFAGRHLIPFLASQQITIRHSVRSPDDSISYLQGILRCHNTATMVIGKQRSSNVLWNKVKQFSEVHFGEKIAFVKREFEFYKQKALRLEMMRIGLDKEF